MIIDWSFTKISSWKAIFQRNWSIILSNLMLLNHKYRSKHSEVFLGKGVLKICCKFTGEHTYQSAIFTKPFPKNTSGRLLLQKETTQLIGTAYCFTVSLLMATVNCAEWVKPFSCITKLCLNRPLLKSGCSENFNRHFKSEDNPLLKYLQHVLSWCHYCFVTVLFHLWLLYIYSQNTICSVYIIWINIFLFYYLVRHTLFVIKMAQ